MGLIDSRSVKTSRNGGEAQGIDGGKKTKGRKQHIITDTLGLVLAAVIHTADIQTAMAQWTATGNLEGHSPGLEKIVADGR